MITVNLMGGLGNQLFQICALLGYSIENKIAFFFRDMPIEHGWRKTTYWDNLLMSLKPFIKNTPLQKVYREQEAHYTPLPKMTPGTLMHGYFQSYKYFYGQKKKIFEILKIEEMKKKTREKTSYDFEDCVSMHFRLGDYKTNQSFHPVLSVEYYENALQNLIQHTGDDDWNVLYFCEHDDISIVSETISVLEKKFPELTFERVGDNYADWEQLLIMSLCSHNIIANSSFSWFGAFFNSNSDKYVFYPDTWLGPEKWLGANYKSIYVEGTVFKNKTSEKYLDDLCLPSWYKVVCRGNKVIEVNRKKPLIFLFIRDDHDHIKVREGAIGGAEYQCYSLINKLKTTYDITCYNKKDACILDDVKYRNAEKDLLNDHIAKETTIIVNRAMPVFSSEIYTKIKNNHMCLWLPDYVHKDSFISRCPFLINYNDSDKKIYENISNKHSFKNDILTPLIKNKNIHFLFKSNFAKQDYLRFVQEFDMSIEIERQHIMYNCLYDDQFVHKPLTSVVNVNQMVFACAWHKGINIILPLFKYICANDPDFCLVLMSPGYDWENSKRFAPQIKDAFGDRINILGPCDKKQFSKVISESLCTLSGRFPETFGNIFSESYSLGTPVLADTYSGAVKEIVDNNYVVNFENGPLVLEKLRELRKNRKTMNVTLDKKFQWESIKKEWEKYI